MIMTDLGLSPTPSPPPSPPPNSPHKRALPPYSPFTIPVPTSFISLYSQSRWFAFAFASPGSAAKFAINS
ncbi:hypothetical protein HBH68_103700 [Parastagonospora nodorum]|nr:hypothetical protein HBH46_104330 [Parastagonospora nodorum]KAH4222136.1 hypothetical protein HBI06_145530 [Parastagonospora nodorum]KAH4232244.1 hypothetical protein HBI05_176100 [Parastagonospora nodorum]KAH5102275.1 hypothetical protein HBH72_085510 [Parastagonospora nodorum]KAH5203887.1 hypothetical protein HBH68_103700 [Parastagonospora nodorum]